MDLVLLPGNSIKNRPWIEDVEKSLSPYFQNSSIQYYKHWEKNEEMIDLDYEQEVLTKTLESRTHFAIFGKSAGTILAIRSVIQKGIKPNYCFFTGTAIKFAYRMDQDINKWIKSYTIPTLYIQKEKDPAFSVNELTDFLKNSPQNNYKIVSIPGDNHHYEDLDLLANEISKFIGS